MDFNGKSTISPHQIPIIHGVSTPNTKEIIFFKKVICEVDSRRKEGIGVSTVGGKMVGITFYDGT